MKNTGQLDIKIEHSFGSNFQKECAISALKLMLESWRHFYTKNHKKNEIKLFGVLEIDTDFNIKERG